MLFRLFSLCLRLALFSALVTMLPTAVPLASPLAFPWRSHWRFLWRFLWRFHRRFHRRFFRSLLTAADDHLPLMVTCHDSSRRPWPPKYRIVICYGGTHNPPPHISSTLTLFSFAESLKLLSLHTSCKCLLSPSTHDRNKRSFIRPVFVSLLDIRNFIFFTFYNGVRYLLRWFALDIVDMIN